MGQRKPTKADINKQAAEVIEAHCLFGRDARNCQLMLRAIVEHRPDLPLTEASGLAVALAKAFRWRVLEAAE